jgi:hypothetical protein
MRTLRTIDQIARAKQRDVCYVTFQDRGDWHHPVLNWQALSHPRHKITDWLQANSIEWEDCFEFAVPECHETYHGHIYIDIAYDETDTKYQALAAFLEDESGNVRLEFGENTKFYLLSIEQAMTNAEHDEPGYWERYYENL